MGELFQLLDEGDGTIETQEFFTGLKQMKGSAQAKDMFSLKKSVDNIDKSVRGIMTVTEQLSTVTSKFMIAPRPDPRPDPRRDETSCRDDTSSPVAGLFKGLGNKVAVAKKADA